MPKYCIFGCPPLGVTMHSFPNPDKNLERLKLWVNLIGGKLESKSDYDYYKKEKVCDIHFTDQDRNRNSRLNALAVPSLYLKGAHEISAISNPHEPTGTQTLSALSDNTAASSSQVHLISEEKIKVTTSNRTDLEPKKQCIVPQQVHAGTSVAVSATAVMMEHSYSVFAKTKRNLYREGSKRSPVYNFTSQKQMQTELKYLRTEICRLRKKSKSFKERLANANKLSNDLTFHRTVGNMKKPAQLFLHMQLQNTKKPKGRRFTIEEKILALSLYKKSPKCYGLLFKYFTLPSARAMKKLLSQIKLTPGINAIIFEKIKKTVSKMETNEKLCSLIFDEMSLTPQIYYDASKDTLEGFTSYQSSKFADHVLVFMIKGVKNNFKQPVAYYFTKGLTKLELKSMIISVINHVQKSGLIIVNTVCDQSTVNVGAITDLVNDTKSNYFKRQKLWRHDLFSVNNQTIIPLYDTPHLIKGIRNNLINKDMVYTINNEEKTLKWEYFQMVKAADKPYGDLCLLSKITEEHINVDKMNKMRVKTATQLFSRSVAAATEHLTARGELPQECRQLIDITILLDNLFDSLNGNTLKIAPDGKIYKGPIKRHSPHHELWQKAKNVLKTVKFVQKKKVADKIRIIETTLPSVKNFIKTIEGMEAIWKLLSEKYSFDVMLTRNFNQDPLENFFGNIRSYGARNIAPNTVSFEGAFKALLLNNYNTLHSKRSNCEEDGNECLQSLDFFLKENSKSFDVPQEAEENEENNIVFQEDLLISNNEDDAGQRNYVCGWVLTKCLKKIIKSCKHCRKTVLDNKDENPENSFIKAKEYNKNKKWLCYPNKKVENCFHEIQNITTSFLKGDVPKFKVKNTILSFTDILVDYPLECPEHKAQLIKYFTDLIITILLHSWCRSVNRILAGKLSYEGDDKIKNAAKLYYDKHKHYRKKKCV